MGPCLWRGFRIPHDFDILGIHGSKFKFHLSAHRNINQLTGTQIDILLRWDDPYLGRRGPYHVRLMGARATLCFEGFIVMRKRTTAHTIGQELRLSHRLGGLHLHTPSSLHTPHSRRSLGGHPSRSGADCDPVGAKKSPTSAPTSPEHVRAYSAVLDAVLIGCRVPHNRELLSSEQIIVSNHENERPFHDTDHQVLPSGDSCSVGDLF